MTPRDRVYLTLLGLADANGRIESFPKTQALDYAEAPEGQFEKLLKELLTLGEVSELPRLGRARRFTLRSIERRTDAHRYIAQRRDRVLALDSLRAQLEPGRAVIVGPALPIPKIVRAEPIAPNAKNAARWSLTVIVPGLGTINRCIYTDGDAGFVSPPTLLIGGEWHKALEWTADFARAVRDAGRAYLADQAVPPRAVNGLP